MKKSVLTLILLSIVTLSYSQVTQFTDRIVWQSSSNNICYTEDFETFLADVDFTNSPVQCNGFTIGRLLNLNSFPNRNKIDVFPYEFDINGSNHAILQVEPDLQEVIITFDEPVTGFFADYYGIGDDRRTVEIYNDDMGMVDSYEFYNNGDEFSHGFISSPDMPISNIVFRALTARDGFSIDNIEIDCSTAPIPTLGQWGIIALSMIMLIFGLVGLKQRKVILG